MLNRWEFVQANIGEWRWQLVDAQGKILKQSVPGFTGKMECLQDAKENGYPRDRLPEYFKSTQILSKG